MQKKNMLPVFLFVLLLHLFSCNNNDLNGPYLVETSQMTDSRDGQTYEIVKIGDQWWMAENLNYYTPSGSWYYNNDSLKFAKKHGRLYLGEIALTKNTGNHSNAIQEVCPPGWHIPTVEEWEELIGYIKKYELTGNDLKLSGDGYWQQPNKGTNRAYFYAVPSGTVLNEGNEFENIKTQARFLTSTPNESTGGVWGFGLDASSPEIKKVPLDTKSGWSIRCIKD